MAVSNGVDSSTATSNGLSSMRRSSHEFTCAICHELFVRAHTLSCSHTFCEQCISNWLRKNKICPICRKAVVGKPIHSIVLGNAIRKLVECLPKQSDNHATTKSQTGSSNQEQTTNKEANVHTESTVNGVNPRPPSSQTGGMSKRMIIMMKMMRRRMMTMMKKRRITVMKKRIMMMKEMMMKMVTMIICMMALIVSMLNITTIIIVMATMMMTTVKKEVKMMIMTQRRRMTQKIMMRLMRVLMNMIMVLTTMACRVTIGANMVIALSVVSVFNMY